MSLVPGPVDFNNESNNNPSVAGDMNPPPPAVDNSGPSRAVVDPPRIQRIIALNNQAIDLCCGSRIAAAVASPTTGRIYEQAYNLLEEASQVLQQILENAPDSDEEDDRMDEDDDSQNPLVLQPAFVNLDHEHQVQRQLQRSTYLFYNAFIRIIPPLNNRPLYTDDDILPEDQFHTCAALLLYNQAMCWHLAALFSGTPANPQMIVAEDSKEQSTSSTSNSGVVNTSQNPLDDLWRRADELYQMALGAVAVVVATTNADDGQQARQARADAAAHGHRPQRPPQLFEQPVTATATHLELSLLNNQCFIHSHFLTLEEMHAAMDRMHILLTGVLTRLPAPGEEDRDPASTPYLCFLQNLRRNHGREILQPPPAVIP